MFEVRLSDEEFADSHVKKGDLSSVSYKGTESHQRYCHEFSDDSRDILVGNVVVAQLPTERPPESETGRGNRNEMWDDLKLRPKARCKT